MSLANGRPYLATPGPSVIPDRVLRAMHQASPNIYAGALVEMVAGLWDDLKAVARTRHHVALYIGNGHAAWEAADANVFAPGDTAIVLATGRFGHGWAEHAHALGVDTRVTDFGLSQAVDLNRAAEALRAAPDARAVLVTHVDTGTSAKNDIAAIRALMDEMGHPGLLMVDCIASLGCDPYRMDDWGVDVTVAACQKGLMTPPGLAIVYFSDRAKEATRPDRHKTPLRTPYWDWHSRADATEFWQNFYGTAPTHLLFGLREALDMIAEEGLDNVHARHERLARAVWAAGEAWAAEGDFRLNMADPAQRGLAVTGMRLAHNDGDRLRHWCEHQAGLTLGIGLGMAKPGDPHFGAHFRLAHMGHVNAHMTLGALAVMDAGMKALGIAHGPGALEAATREIAH